MRIRSITAVALVLSAGCDEDTPPPKQPVVVLPGGLDRAQFVYGCAGPADAQCDVDADLAPVRDASPFPLLAVGGRFELVAQTKDLAPLALDVASGAFLSLDADGKTLTALEPGLVSVVASRDGVPLDFADVELVEPANLKILQATPQGSFKGVDIDLGDGSVSATANVDFTFKFRAVVTDADGAILAGDFPCVWSSSDPAVAAITSDPEENIVTVVSGSAGSAVITVDLGDFSGLVTIEVGP